MSPFWHLALKAKKLDFREDDHDFLKTWGDHIKTRRLDFKLTKRQLSFNLNVSDVTIYLWERNKVRPSLAQIPRIIEFLGQYPLEKKAENLGEKLREYRRIHGLTQQKLAERLGVDETTVGGWEKGKHRTGCPETSS